MIVELIGKVMPSHLEYHKWRVSKTISIDLKAKRAIICSTGGDEKDIPNIWLSHTEGTLHLNKRAKSDITELSFPEFKGYTIMCSEISKYTLTITFIKR